MSSEWKQYGRENVAFTGLGCNKGQQTGAVIGVREFAVPYSAVCIVVVVVVVVVGSGSSSSSSSVE